VYVSPDTIRTAEASERGDITALMTASFISDPFMRWIYPAAQDYLEHFPGFVERFAGAAFDHATVFVAGGFGGGALWFPPGAKKDEEALGQFVLETVAPERLAAMGTLSQQMAEHQVEREAWYLPMIGVDPPRQGAGLGAELMRRVLDETDRAGLPTHLESSNPANIPFYQRLGYEAVGMIQPVEDGPILTPMFRAAR